MEAFGCFRGGENDVKGMFLLMMQNIDNVGSKVDGMATKVDEAVQAAQEAKAHASAVTNVASGAAQKVEGLDREMAELKESVKLLQDGSWEQIRRSGRREQITRSDPKAL